MNKEITFWDDFINQHPSQQSLYLSKDLGKHITMPCRAEEYGIAPASCDDCRTCWLTKIADAPSTDYSRNFHGKTVEITNPNSYWYTQHGTIFGKDKEYFIIAINSNKYCLAFLTLDDFIIID